DREDRPEAAVDVGVRRAVDGIDVERERPPAERERLRHLLRNEDRGPTTRADRVDTDPVRRLVELMDGLALDIGGAGHAHQVDEGGAAHERLDPVRGHRHRRDWIDMLGVTPYRRMNSPSSAPGPDPIVSG